MTTNDTYLAVFLGSKTSPRMKAWMALPEAERRAKEQEGMAAWKTWVEKHHAAVSAMGGPLGKTKKITERGIEDVSAIAGVPGPFYVPAWHPLNPDLLPAIAELAESQKQRFVEAVQELQRRLASSPS